MADYDGLRFSSAGSRAGPAGAGVAMGHYQQDGDLVTAEFSGGPIRAGRLVGTTRHDGTIDAAYCFVQNDGETVSGVCVSTPSMLPDGRLRLTEHWRRLDGSSGVSHVEQVAQ